MWAGVCLLTRCAATAIQDLRVLIMSYTAVKIKIAVVTDSTNYIDTDGTLQDTYSVAPILTAKRENAVRKFLYGKTIILIFQ